MPGFLCERLAMKCWRFLDRGLSARRLFDEMLLSIASFEMPHLPERHSRYQAVIEGLKTQALGEHVDNEEYAEMLILQMKSMAQVACNAGYAARFNTMQEESKVLSMTTNFESEASPVLHSVLERLDAIEKENKALRAELEQLRKASLRSVTFNLTGLDFSGYDKGSFYESPPVTLLGIEGIHLRLHPRGGRDAPPGRASLYLVCKSHVKLSFRFVLDDVARSSSEVRQFNTTTATWGFVDFCGSAATFAEARVEILEARF
eukprot:TRINITY_DN31311_c0_g1_i2.p1 TRINITY_DN31311_c0_g1~~TRINITY_DN31311_c0_g1_i2.p1  ORF type:complete len:261 (-),score=39.92 TRINITY_DN31311_c0_g1_i2:211-993(-)